MMMIILVPVLTLSSSFNLSEEAAAAASASSFSFSPLHNIRQQHVLQICCAWDYRLANGILTYRIIGGSSKAQQAVIQAIDEWNSKITGINLVEISDNNMSADIDIKFSSEALQVIGSGSVSSSGGHTMAIGKSIRLVEPGESIINFNNGLVTHIDITISTSALGSSFNSAKLESITKHEIGHAFGIGHTNFIGDLMSPILTGKTKTTISACDINAISAANQWKLGGGESNSTEADHNNTPHAPSVDFVRC
jgi:predicted Zn-dependent protease